MEDYKSKFELAQVVRQFGKDLLQKHAVSPLQIKALHNIVNCRTAQLGGHEEVCDHCGLTRYSYNSCGDRHCPKCQLTKQVKWVEDITKFVLPVKHYHIIFTVPHQLNEVCLWDQKLYYSILFSAMWRTLHSFGYAEHGAETGAIAILHSWGQNLSLHPHLHCIVPAAGFSLQGEWKHIGNDKFLYPVKQLSATFKGKFLDSLKRKLKEQKRINEFNQQIQLAYKTPWVVFCEPPLAHATNVIHYLGQYTHRVGISNDRIIDVTETHVKFMAKDYRDNAKEKPTTLTGVEFLRRFCLHVLPWGFVRIRRFGIYNPTMIRSMGLVFRPQQQNPKDKPQKETALQCYSRITGFNPDVCPRCRNKSMKIVEITPRPRSPSTHLKKLLIAKLN